MTITEEENKYDIESYTSERTRREDRMRQKMTRLLRTEDCVDKPL